MEASAGGKGKEDVDGLMEGEGGRGRERVWWGVGRWGGGASVINVSQRRLIKRRKHERGQCQPKHATLERYLTLIHSTHNTHFQY